MLCNWKRVRIIKAEVWPDDVRMLVESLAKLAVLSFGPVDKSKNSAETHRFSGRTLELEIEIDGIYHSLKV